MIPDEIDAFIGESVIVQVQGKYFSSAYMRFDSDQQKNVASVDGNEAAVRLRNWFNFVNNEFSGQYLKSPLRYTFWQSVF